MLEKIILEQEVFSWKFQIVEKQESKTYSLNFIENKTKEKTNMTYWVTKLNRIEKYMEFCVNRYNEITRIYQKYDDFKKNIFVWIENFETFQTLEYNQEDFDWLFDLEEEKTP